MIDVNVASKCLLATWSWRKNMEMTIQQYRSRHRYRQMFLSNFFISIATFFNLISLFCPWKGVHISVLYVVYLASSALRALLLGVSIEVKKYLARLQLKTLTGICWFEDFFQHLMYLKCKRLIFEVHAFLQ